MKRLVIISFYLLVCFSLNAQTVEWSNQQKVKPKNNYTQIIGENANGIYMLRSRSSEYSRELTIEKYRSNLALDKSIEMWQPPGSYLEKMVLEDAGLLAFASIKSGGANQVSLFYWRMDPNLNTTQVTSLLLKVDADKFRDKNVFYIRQNADRSLTTVMFVTKGADASSCVLNIYGFDKQLGQTFFKQFPFSYEVDDLFITSVEVDNAGNLFTLIDFPGQKLKEKEQRRFMLYAFMNTAQTLLEYELKRDSMAINELGLVVNNYAKTLTVAGFYNKINEKKLTGSFIYTVDITTAKAIINEFEPFDRTFVTKVAGMMLNETSAGLSDLYIRKLIPRSDGGCVIVAEKYYETTQSYTYYVNGFPQVGVRVIHNFDEIVVISKKGDGKTQYREFFKKNQSTMSDGGYYSSFVVVNTNEKLVFVYNTEVTTEGDIMISTITPDGVTDTRVLIKSMSYYAALMPPESRQVSSNSSLICTLKDRRFSIMRLRF